MLGWCNYCHKLEHPPECPNYIPPKPVSYCDICGEGIYKGEEYIENEDGKLGHYDCFYNIDDLLNWLGYKIKTMADDCN